MGTVGSCQEVNVMSILSYTKTLKGSQTVLIGQEERLRLNGERDRLCSSGGGPKSFEKWLGMESLIGSREEKQRPNDRKRIKKMNLYDQKSLRNSLRSDTKDISNLDL